MRGVRGVYAYVCGECRHLLSTEHLLHQDDAGEWIVHCRICPCVTTQDAPVLTLDQAGYERYLAAKPLTGGSTPEPDSASAHSAPQE